MSFFIFFVGGLVFLFLGDCVCVFFLKKRKVLCLFSAGSF